MLALLLVQIGSSMPIYGNFSQYYYYVELNNKKWILDQAFDGAVEYFSCLDDGKSKNVFFLAQRFIQILSIPLDKNMIRKGDSTNYTCQDTCKMQIGNFTINYYCAISYNYIQEINNYLGLGQIVQNLNSNQQLKLCLAQNGGYMKIGNFKKDDEDIKIDFVVLNCIMKSNCERNRLQFTGLEIKQFFIQPQNSKIQVVVDFTNVYVDLPSSMYMPLIKHIQCQGAFCPRRNDHEGLICYDNDYDNVDKFYQKFPNIRFYFHVSSKFVWFPQDYLVTHDNKTYCFPIRGGASKIILGQPFMRNKEFIFGKERLIVNYQNCSEETSLDAPTISMDVIAHIFIHHLLHPTQVKIEKYKLIIDQSTHSMIILLLFSIVSSQLIFDLKRDVYKGEYLIELDIGTPSQKANFIVDTGAPITSFICNTKSNTQNLCNQDKYLFCLKQFVTYGGELSNAIQASDLMKIGKNKITLNFECISEDSSQILGLGSSSYFIQALYEEFKFQSEHLIFSILLRNENGKLTVGQDYSNYNDSSIPFSNSSDYFQVDLDNVSDDHNNVVFQPNQPEDYEIIVDTGSTLINMDSETFQSFIKPFSKCEKDPRGCPQKHQIYGYQCYFYNRPHYGDISNFYETFPEFSFNFKNGYKYKLNAKDYLINLQDDYYCLPFEGYTRNYENKFKKMILLGQPFMRNKEFYFDLKEYKIFIKDPEASSNFLHYTNLSDLVLNIYIFVEIGFIIGICFFYRKYSTQIRGMFRSSRPNQGVNPYA